MKKIIYTILGSLLSIPLMVSALNITVPSAPGAGYWLTSTSTGAWIASSTDPMIIGSLIATTTSPSSIMGYVGIGTASPAHRLDVVGNINVSAGSAYKYNGANVITASTTLNNYFFGGAGNLTMTGAYNTASGVSALAFNTTGNYNTANGSLALYANTTGSDNSSFGVQSLFVNTSGSYNTSVGTLSLPSNTTGSNNTASGMGSLYSNTTGNNNASLGNNSLWGITTGNGNTAIGSYAGYGDGTANMQSTVDNYATFLGYQASRDASVASTTPLTNITAIGKNAKVGASNTIVLGGTGADAVNVGIGTVAPAEMLSLSGTNPAVSLSNGSEKSYFGTYTNLSQFAYNRAPSSGMIPNTAQSVAFINVAGGTGASLISFATANTINTQPTINMTIAGSGNVGIGTTTPTQKLDVAGNINVSAGSAYKYNGANVITASTTLNNYFFGGAGNLTMTGAYNTASGVQALYSNTTGYYNTASGVNALYFNTTGFNNTASGVQALYSNTTGTYNTASGVNSLQSNTSGTQNSAVGFSSLTANTIGSYNTANGTYALASNTIGSQNISIGYASLYSNTTGFGNVALGSQSGYGDGTANMQSTVDNYATFLGYQASRDASVASTTPLTNITAIGKNARVGASNTIVLGGTGADAVNVGIGTVAPAYKLEVVGNLKTSTTIGTGGYTVATLPTGQATGTRAYVTDALAPTFLGTLTGGGAVVSPAFFNGSAWVAN